ncbi:hypothetical protein LTR99_007005 [Exophiala xenobiotica]|uniref:DUF1275 domain protein n=1 Tax=Vermiconidia calcicola TaxID=1690605 RepID=A0AAV9Q375_9PEZI|nr:hypothetical protein LTR92_006822 [Exophiala xenobiotica]KAK5532006.1 hypothetical protein LTR25_008336 [Vermiconidia calcicola]KAK5539471.1 hypothetical protein LTR23_006491 [Chaetothyriales sp. CCFEE 6169]KAK5269571.1 hypothetical protein LTR96_005267 [Exophiala xenobiotica]KAK5300258.1 hypothetical protein LTR99_007005 [Exophiala xenobiotica]
MPNISFPEDVESHLRRIDSCLTLTNTYTSTYPPARQASGSSSRAGSLDRQKKRANMGYAEGNHRRRQGTIQKYLNHELSLSYMSLVITICFFISGLVDSVAFNSWNCFVNMQTGNTVFAALGLGGLPKASHGQQYYKSLTAIGSFCLGALFFSALHRYPTGLSSQPTSRRRWIFVVSFLLQTVLMIIPAILVTLDLVSNQPFVPGSFSSGSSSSGSNNNGGTGTGTGAGRTGTTTGTLMTNFLDLCPVALLSFQAAGQTTLSRLLAVLDMPTIVLSALYFDFTADCYSLRQSWRSSSGVWDFVSVQQKKQGKRFCCIVALFTGGITGGEMYKSQAGMAGALWTAAGLKMVIVMGWLFWPEELEGGWEGGEDEGEDIGDERERERLPR